MPDSRPRVLCAGMYLADVENSARHVADVLARSREVDVEQRWIGWTTRGSETDLHGTVATVTQRTPKCILLDRLLDGLQDFDRVLFYDDDIEIAETLIAVAQYRQILQAYT